MPLVPYPLPKAAAKSKHPVQTANATAVQGKLFARSKKVTKKRK